jgi:DNA modification methylase
MRTHATGKTWTIQNGDCREMLRELEADSIDAVVTDPPYGLSFMGKEWDHGVPGVEFWREVFRVAKPGCHVLAFGGTRTFHRLAVAIEDSGFEIRDCVMWVYGSGFPKSMNIGKAIDKAAGAVREKIRTPYQDKYFAGMGDSRPWSDRAAIVGFHEHDSKTPATADAARWNGWGTALKPAWEPIIVARKPFAGTLAANVLANGTGALNIEGCRVPGTDHIGAWTNAVSTNIGAGKYVNPEQSHRVDLSSYAPSGRWPANLIHDGDPEVLKLFPDELDGDSGSAARFFYCAKTSPADRDDGLDDFERKNNMRVNAPRKNEDEKHATRRGNHHPTVKPTDLMRYCVRLVTPPGGLVLDPFMGSGSTGRAALLEGMRFHGVDLSPEYCDISAARIRACETLFTA